MKKILLILGLFCIFVLSWASLWFGLIGFILIIIAMLIALVESGKKQ